MTRRRPAPLHAARFPPALQAIAEEAAQRLAAALIDATGPHAARVTLPPAICSERADGAVTWRLLLEVDLVLPDQPPEVIHAEPRR